MKCLLCGKTGTPVLYNRRTQYQGLFRKEYTILRCIHCQLLYISPLPTDEDLATLYEYREHMSAFIDDEKWQAWNAQTHFLRQVKLIEKFNSGKKMLDVGCSDGLFLRVAREREWETYGVELSPRSSQIARERYSLKVVTGTLHTADFPANFFDVVVMGHILEHVREPAVFLVEAGRVLRSKGLIHVAVPCLDTKVLELLERVFIKGLRDKLIGVMGAVDPPAHLSTFSTIALRKALDMTGFTVLETVYTTKIRPWFMDKKQWALDTAIAPLMTYVGSGLHVEMLARKREI